MIRAIVVDDEPLAREGIINFLSAETDIEVVAECSDGEAAVRAIDERNPDLVFLDIQMPEMDGFEVLHAISEDRVPAVIFVTAYDEYALKAFSVHAVDYLLKPVEAARFAEALERVRRQLRTVSDDGISQHLMALLADVRTSRSYRKRLVVRSGSKVAFIRTEEIDWIQAARNYARIAVNTKTYLHRETMDLLERQLDPDRFFRTHRSAIINLDRVKEIQPMTKHEHVIVMSDGTRLPLSASRKTRLLELVDPTS